MKTVRYLVSGKVQGVSFRYYTFLKAGELGLKGTVRNLPDARVEIIATGNDVQITAMQEWASKGPAMAKVERVEMQIITTTTFDDFKILRN